MAKASKITPEQVAAWMLDELERDNYLHQETVVHKIASQFGEPFTYRNESGNRAIRKDVLNAFRKLTGESVIWARGTRMWRKRRQHDRSGRQQY
jgi:hypothetical protein